MPRILAEYSFQLQDMVGNVVVMGSLVGLVDNHIVTFAGSALAS